MIAKEAVKGISAFGNFLSWIKDNDKKGLEDRLVAVLAVKVAAIKARQYTRRLRSGVELTDDEKFDFEDRISTLWGSAATEISRFDKKLGEECFIKAFGWGTGNWNDPAFDVVPRRVEEVLADAMKLTREFEAALSEDVIH
jgi:hypothetical protein